MSSTSLQRAAYIVAYTTFAVGLLTVFLRIYCRLHVLKSWGWDDHVAVFVGVSIAIVLILDAKANRITQGRELRSASYTAPVSLLGLRLVGLPLRCVFNL